MEEVSLDYDDRRSENRSDVSDSFPSITLTKKIKIGNLYETFDFNDDGSDEENQIDWSKWISASATRNYLIKDPLLDWLSYHSSSAIIRKPDYATGIVKAVTSNKKDNFTEFIMSQGHDFEDRVMECLYNKYKDMIYDVGGNLNSRSSEKALDTINKMKEGVPIIYQGVLHNSDDQTYGVPDLIVRSDWINKIVRNGPLTDEEEQISAPNLENCIEENIGEEGKISAPYHYRIIDIKFTTLKLRADGIHLLNSGSIPAYKGQLYIYNEALAKIQGYKPFQAYILGRKWKYQKKKVVYKGNSCIEKLGVVNYATIDKEYIQRTKDAVSWIKEMRRDGANWSLGPVLPLCRKELYPNMSNPFDYPWRSIKKRLASEIKEITSLWMCGVKNRNIAIEKEIYQWTDPRCTTEAMGINGEKTKRVLNKILDINRKNIGFIQPSVILNNDEEWQTPKNIEFYVDFEFINEVVSDFTQMPRSETRSIIFMIGVGYFDPGSPDQSWKYRVFIADALTEAAEYKICCDTSQYIREEAEWYDCPNPLLIHWSNAENWQWDHAIERHKDKNQRIWIPSKKGVLAENLASEPKWFDLLQIFRKEPIVIKGCLGFGLKEVAGSLSKMGLIGEVWNGESSCTDGSGAMLSAYKVYKDAENKGVDPKTLPLMKDMIKYNEVDCKVLGDIIRYLRENHGLPEVDDEVILYD